MSRKQAAIFRVASGASWSRYRVMRRYLKQLGVVQAGEKQVRQVQKAVQCGQTKIEYINLEHDNPDINTTDTRLTPVAYIANLSNFVSNLLDKYEETGLLTSHTKIPDDEVWVKIGGDHGGGSLKIMLQIANVRKPNSKHNTFLISLANSKDTHVNLDAIIKPYEKEIENLNKMTWKTKKIRVFPFGDYDFLLKIFGLSSAASTHPCLYCKASKDQYQTPASKRPESEKQSYSNIKKDNRAYRRAGSKKKNAKAYNNVIHQPLLKIDENLLQVTPPYLHLLLGIAKKHHTLLEHDCHHLDKEIAKHIVEEERDITKK